MSRIGEKGLQAWRAVVLAVEFDEMRRAVAVRKLHEAKAIAVWVEAERFGVDCDAIGK